MWPHLQPRMAVENPKVEQHCALTLQDVDPSVAQEGVGKHLLSELNRHADVVLQGLPTSVGTSANTEGLAQAMWEAQQVCVILRPWEHTSAEPAWMLEWPASRLAAGALKFLADQRRPILG